MLEIVFTVLLIAMFGNILGWAIKAAWGIIKILSMLVLLPLILVGMVFVGLIYIAIPIAVFVGIVALIGALMA